MLSVKHDIWLKIKSRGHSRFPVNTLERFEVKLSASQRATKNPKRIFLQYPDFQLNVDRGPVLKRFESIILTRGVKSYKIHGELHIFKSIILTKH